MIQFRKDDTTIWQERYGNLADGDATPSGAFGNAKTTFSGVSGNNTGAVGSNTGFSIGDIVLIHQTRNGGDGAGKWQLNKITNIVSTTFTFKYNLQQNFDTTAQIIKINQNKDITINGTLSAPQWDGSTGSIIVLMGNSVQGTGTIDLVGAGYRGGLGNNNSNSCGDTGEGTSGASVVNNPNANGNGGSGGNVGPNAPARPPAGGSYGTLGTGTNPGNTFGDVELVVIVPGGGGGGKGMDSPTQNDGQRGGGILIIIAKSIDLSGMTIVKADGNNAQTNAAAGAGGGILLKGQTVKLGTGKVTSTGGTGGNNQGGNGRINVDYGLKVTGSTNPVSNTRQDSILNDSGFLGLF